MYLKQFMPLAGMAVLMASCSHGTPEPTQALFTDYVDPKIGSGGHGHVFVGADVPFGMVQVGPTSIPQDWDWCSGYHESDSTIIGFSQTHLSGTGIGDLFDITIMPVIGDVTYARGSKDDPASGLWSYGDRSKEVTRPGYYSVPLTRYGITAEMTATPRVGMHRYTFPASDEAAIIFDLQNGGCWDRPTSTHIEAVNDSTLEGWRHSSGWANDQKVFFVAEFSKPFESFTLNGDNDMYGRASFKTDAGEQLLVKVALSPVSIKNARKNLDTELDGWDFDNTADNALTAWNDALSRVKIETSDEDARKIFYTALYHLMIAPSLFSDVDADTTLYTTFSLWDTYRAAMPLMTVLCPDMMPDIINTMLDIYDKQGRLPVWHLWGCETDCMVGNPGIPVVADAIVKNIPGFDREKAYQAIKSTALNPGRGGDLRQKYGYIPNDMMKESVAYDLEYALADGAAARAARALGHDEDAEFFEQRSKSYKNYYDQSTGFLRGRDSKGNWREPFSPFSSSHRTDDYCEGNAWQYTWLVPHDVPGLQECFGSRELIISKLDSLFTVSSQLDDEASPDISGLIGQYAHGNEPSHHVLYLYTMLGEPWKTADRVRETLSTLYSTNPDGLSGNEDVGQMSAWYIMSALGFYEVEPAGGRYWIGTPIFDKAEIEVPGGTFTIIADGNSVDNPYIQSVTLNGAQYDKPYITHDDIMKGGTIVFKMGSDKTAWYDTENPTAL